jgi:hypothetical protein
MNLIDVMNRNVEDVKMNAKDVRNRNAKDVRKSAENKTNAEKRKRLNVRHADSRN